MFGFTTFEQSKKLYDSGYRRPNPIYVCRDNGFTRDTILGTPQRGYYPCFSLADLIILSNDNFEAEYEKSKVIIDDLITDLLLTIHFWADNNSKNVISANNSLKEAYK